MKKYFLSATAIVLALAFSAFTNRPSSADFPEEEPLNWYLTTDAGLISSSSPSETNEVRSVERQNVGCLDQVNKFCRYGTTATSMTVGTNISSAPAEQIIKKSN
jgi:hypothetical protein